MKQHSRLVSSEKILPEKSDRIQVLERHGYYIWKQSE